MKKISLIPILAFLMGACQPSVSTVAPTFPPFPTMTPGQVLVGVLPTANALGSANLSNPATAMAFTNRPTPTPNLSACPVLDGNATLPRKPATAEVATDAILGFLQDGGAVNELKEGLRVRWEALGDTGYIRDDVDLTGEGATEVVIGYTAPNDTGMLLIIGCSDGQYVARYTYESGTRNPPQLIFAGDINNALPAELTVATQTCTDAENCEYDTQVLAWDGVRGRFINLLDNLLLTLELPEIKDIDNDLVGEIVVNLKSRGNSTTGPLRTGVNIWDWNGAVYTLSIIQLDSPRYYVQLIHEGDKLFSQLKMSEALQTYALVLDTTDLRFWFNDEEPILKSYALYRMLLAFAYLSDGRLADVAQRMNTEFPITADTNLEEFPIYALMGYRFLDSLQVNPDLHSACVDVLAIVAESPEALNLLNRYGSRSPQYAELDLCPF